MSRAGVPLAEKCTQVSITLPNELQDRMRLYLLRRQAQGENINLSSLVRRFLTDLLAQQETKKEE